VFRGGVADLPNIRPVYRVRTQYLRQKRSEIVFGYYIKFSTSINKKEANVGLLMLFSHRELNRDMNVLNSVVPNN
jgi:hypothetical protein